MIKSKKTIDGTRSFCYNKRMLTEKLAKIYREVGADVVYTTTDYLRRYLTDFHSSDGYVLLDGERCRFIADSRYFEAAQKALKNSPIEVLLGGKKQADELLQNYKCVGVPFSLITHGEYCELADRGFCLKDSAPAFQTAMIVKSEYELEQISRASEIAEDAFNALLPQIKEGMTEREVAALLEYEMRRRGAEGTSFDTICAFGANGSVPHYETGDCVLKFGDVILIDFGCKVNGYCSDITRTFLFGDDGKHEAFKAAYAEVLKAHLLVKEQLKSGMTGKEADAIAREHLKSKGLGEAFTHSLGHGIGLNVHELPMLSPRSEQILTDGMVFSDEPGVYFAGEFGIRIEDSCYLKDGKVRSFMHKTEKNLIIL